MTPTEARRRRRWWHHGPAIATAVPILAAYNDGEPPGAATTSGPTLTRSPEQEAAPTAGRLTHRLGVAPVLIVVAVVIVATAGFVATRDGGNAPASQPPVVDSTAAATTTARPDPAQAATDAFFAYEEAFLAAAVIPDPDHPALRETATGENLADDVAQLRAWQLSGRVVRPIGAPTEGLRVLTARVQPDGTAKVRACITDDDHVVIAATGQVVNDEVVTRLVDLTLVMDGGNWKVSRFRVTERWEGVAGCAANTG